MDIDIKTIVLITGITHFLQVLVFYHLYRTMKNLQGPKWWLLWSAAESVGFILILLRNSVPHVNYIILIQSPIIFLGTIFIYIGILRFFDKPVNKRFIFLLFASYYLIHIFYLFVIDNITARTLIFDIYISFMGFYTGAAILKYKTPAINSTSIFNAVLLLIHGSLFAYRSVMILLGTPIHNVFDQNFFNFSQYFDALFIALMWTFGFIMLLNQKLHSEISETKNHFQQIFHLSPDAVLITRLEDEIVVDCNESFSIISGYSKEEAIGKSTAELNLWSIPEHRDKLFTSIREKGFSGNFETSFYSKDKQVLFGSVNARLITLNGMPHLISVIHNITERKKTEEEITSKNNELIRLNHEKEKFFSIIAHDLKSPFQGLIGYSEILSKEYNSLSEDEKIAFINSIEELSHSSYKLLENLLQWTRLQTGQMHFNPEYFNLNSEIHSTISLLKQTALNKNIDLIYKIDSMLFVTADKNMLSTIIRNIVSNSIKFTEKKGNIEFTAEAKGDKAVFRIKDSGIGMDEPTVAKLFSIDKSTSRKGTANEEGTGLGLLLCKEMIEKHGGSIIVESEVGKGTAFTFTL